MCVFQKIKCTGPESVWWFNLFSSGRNVERLVYHTSLQSTDSKQSPAVRHSVRVCVVNVFRFSVFVPR